MATPEQQNPNAVWAFLRSTGFPLTQPLVDGTVVGSFYVCLNRTINATDTTVSIGLGRTPSGYIVLTRSANAVLFNGTNQGSDWSPTQIVLRSSTTATYSFLVC